MPAPNRQNRTPSLCPVSGPNPCRPRTRAQSAENGLGRTNRSTPLRRSVGAREGESLLRGISAEEMHQILRNREGQRRYRERCKMAFEENKVLRAQNERLSAENRELRARIEFYEPQWNNASTGCQCPCQTPPVEQPTTNWHSYPQRLQQQQWPTPPNCTVSQNGWAMVMPTATAAGTSTPLSASSLSQSFVSAVGDATFADCGSDIGRTFDSAALRYCSSEPALDRIEQQLLRTQIGAEGIECTQQDEDDAYMPNYSHLLPSLPHDPELMNMDMRRAILLSTISEGGGSALNTPHAVAK